MSKITAAILFVAGLYFILWGVMLTTPPSISVHHCLLITIAATTLVVALAQFSAYMGDVCEKITENWKKRRREKLSLKSPDSGICWNDLTDAQKQRAVALLGQATANRIAGTKMGTFPLYAAIRYAIYYRDIKDTHRLPQGVDDRLSLLMVDLILDLPTDKYFIS